MLTFEMNGNDRKILVKRIGELLGVNPVYQNAPTFAYQIGEYSVDREGNLTVKNKKADPQILIQLMREGILKEKKIEMADGEAAPMVVRIELPLRNHTGCTLRNLMNMLHSRAPLINKATGSDFYIDEALTDQLAEEMTPSVEKVKSILADYGSAHPDGLKGIELSENRILFTGFPEYTDSESLKAWMTLAALMNKQAISQHRIQAKSVKEDNEKYAFRIWLMRLGMNGDEYKGARKILLRKLKGHAAFRTEEEVERAKEKMRVKRDELRAAKAAVAEQEVPSTP